MLDIFISIFGDIKPRNIIGLFWIVFAILLQTEMGLVKSIRVIFSVINKVTQRPYGIQRILTRMEHTLQACKCARIAGIFGNFCPVVGGGRKAQIVTLASPTAPRGHNNNKT